MGVSFAAPCEISPSALLRCRVCPVHLRKRPSSRREPPPESSGRCQQLCPHNDMQKSDTRPHPEQENNTVSHVTEGETSSLQSRCFTQPEFALRFAQDSSLPKQGNHLDLSAPFGGRRYQQGQHDANPLCQALLRAEH